MIFGTLQTNKTYRRLAHNLGLLSSTSVSLKTRCTNIILGHWPWIVERLGTFSAPDQRLITKEVTHPSSGGGGGTLIPQTTVGSRTGGFL